MRSRPRALGLALLGLALVAPVGPRLTALSAPASQPTQQPPPAPPAAEATVGVTASRVAVDLVVRDGKGRLVRDLTKADVEVLEDGAPQEVLSIRLVDTVGGARALPSTRIRETTPSPASSATPTPTAAPPEPDEHPLFLAFLFDRLSPQARRTACDAAVEWLKRPSATTPYVGVFRIDQGLETLRPFSDDQEAAVEAVHLILESAPTTYRSKSDRERLRGLRREERGHPPPRSEERPRDARSRDGRLPRQRHQRDREVPPSGRGGPRLVLPPRVRAQ